MAKSKLVKANKRIAEEVEDKYKKIEDSVVGSYKKIEKVIVTVFSKIEDKFVDYFLTEEGESVEQAKIRLMAEEKMRKEAGIKEIKKHDLKHRAMVEANMKATGMQHGK